MMRVPPILILAGVMAASSAAVAKPSAPSVFCERYPDAPSCAAGTPACTFCHQGTPPPRNLYGQAVEAQLLVDTPRPLSDQDFQSALPGALAAAESEDSDSDGFLNLDEIFAGTAPNDALSFPDPTGCSSNKPNPLWDVCNYDPRYVFKKINIDFCGSSPSYAEVAAFGDAPDPMSALHAELNRCLDSEFWLGRDGQLWRLAHAKIKPLLAIKDGPTREERGPVPLGDYNDDYALFIYTHSDDRDVREVLTADYFVAWQEDPPSYAQVQNLPRQSLPANRRAGMLTTRWFLVVNTMFTAVPRTTAAQAYRAFLGTDIARLEGLSPVEGEPIDYDDKGVQQEACKTCHSTLDPLSYPFKNYNGLTGFPFGTYQSNRIENYFQGESAIITSMPEAGVILGQPVADLAEWASVAANSDEFAANAVLDFWKLLLGHKPLASEQEEFAATWRSLRDAHGYQIEAMLHDLIETEAYGVP